MPLHAVTKSSHRLISRDTSHRLSRRILLAGTSAIALSLLQPQAYARPIGASGATSATAIASEAAAVAAATAQAAAQQSQASMTRALQSIQALKAAQAAARAAAGAAGTNGVTDGLSAGGLIVDPRVTAGTDANLWINANPPTQTTGNGHTTVTVQQTAQRAVMTWQQFNVGRNTILNFDQSLGNSSNGNSWVALNRIDASGVPSQIQGQINAQGTVLIINPNGIIFNGTSQINVHTLIASTLDINAYASNSNVSVFAKSGTYVPVTVNGLNQVAANGSLLFAPPNEDSANVGFIGSGLYTNTGSNVAGNPFTALIMSAGKIPGQTSGGVTVQAGATITTDVSGFDNGGYVALLGSQVSNAGSITSPAGQIILAAGNDPTGPNQPNVYLAQFGGTSISVSTLTPISNGTPAISTGVHITSGTAVANQGGGLLSADRGNITLLGDNVSQLGTAETTTSITRAGSFSITANQLLTFGPNSITAILPDENGETIPLNAVSAFVPPSISISAASVDVQGNQSGVPGALIVAPGASLNATSATVANSSVTPTGRFLMESGSIIDLGGLDATTSVANYLYTFKVTSNDVADSPLAQGLIGQTVTIDLRLSGTRADGLTWVGSPLFSATGSGYLNNIPQSIDQLLTKGGSLSFNSISSGFQPFTDVLQAPGSIVNVAGGALIFTGAMVNTTRLIANDGRFYAIGNAQPTLAYGVAGSFTVDHAHWSTTSANVEEIYTSPFAASGYFDPGYVDGASGGSLSVQAINPVLEGTLLATTYLGSRQGWLNQIGTGLNNAQLTPDQLPVGSALSITTLGGVAGMGADVIALQSSPSDVLGPGFNMTSNLVLPSVNLLSQIKPGGNVVLPSSVVVYSTDRLSADGFGSITMSSPSEISMAKGATLSVQNGGSIKLSGASTIDGTLSARSGKITISGYAGTFLFFAPPTSQVTIGPDALLDVSGLWVNDTGAIGAEHGPAYINGGSVTIQTFAEGSSTNGKNAVVAGLVVADTTQSIVLAPGSVIDVSSGGYVQSNGKVQMGSNGLPSGVGGSLSLLTYVNPGWINPNPSQQGQSVQSPTVAPNSGNEPNQANVFMEGTIYDGGLSSGGSFALQAPTIQVGGVSAVTSFGPSSQRAGEIDLPASFFASNGFSSYALTSTYGSATVVAGTQVVLEQLNYVLPNTLLPGNGASLRNFASLALLPLGMRPLANFSLTELPYAFGGLHDISTNAGVLLDTGASISADPGASIALTAGGPVTVLGSIRAPGGSIALTNNGSPEDLNQLAQGNNLTAGATQAPLDIWIGPNALLDVSGTFIPNLQVSTYETGSVLSGGSITLSGGSVIAVPGSFFDLAGANATVQFPQLRGALHAEGFGSQPIWSNGGTLTLIGDPSTVAGSFQDVFFDGTINAAGGAPQAAGGILNVGEFSVGGGYGAVIVQQGGSMTALLKNSALTTSGAAYPTTSAQLAALVPNTKGYAYISANTLNNSGFDSVSLMGTTIAFSGNLTINVPDRLTLAGSISLLAAGNLDPTVNNLATIGKTVVNLNAGYALMVNRAAGALNLSDGTLNVNATTQIDLAGTLSVSNAADVNLNAGGDIRFVAEADPEFSTGLFLAGHAVYFPSTPVQTSQNLQFNDGMLEVPDNLTLTAREIYPSTDTAFLLISTGLSSSSVGTVNTITIASNGKAPVAPLSVNGEVLIDAKNIIQSGVLLAPLGTIELGLSSGQSIPTAWSAISTPSAVPTVSLILAPGSITSVSAAGLEVPYGTTVNDANWTTFLAQTGNGAPTMIAPPSKSVLLNGATVSSMSGAVVDLSGGGDIYATEFVPGSGGSRNVLTGAGSGQTVYALVPGYSAAVAAYDPVFGQAVGAGTSVTLAGGNGIAAGTYILLPAVYATLPGAYRVVVSSTTTTMPTSGVGVDGTFYTTGILGNAITGTRAAQPVLLQIQSDAVWSRYSEIDITHGNGYFANLAAAAGTVTPPLPIDGGVLTVNATSVLNLSSSYNFAPALGGRGGEAAITGTNLLVLAPDQSEPAVDKTMGYIVLNSDQLSNLGATTLLLGGTSTLGAAGLAITATATSLEVDTDAAHALSAPDLLLVTLAKSGTRGLTVDAGSVISAIGNVPAGTDTNITIGTGTAATASGALLRVSNGQPVTIIRTGATAPNASFAIGTTPGTTTIPTTPGAPVVIDGGVSLTLDSSGAGTLAPNAILLASNYLLSGSQINFGNAPASTPGLTISPQLIAQFGGANSVTLRSASGFDSFDTGPGGVSLGTTDPIGTLTLDGSWLYSNGGVTAIAANNIDLINSKGTATAPSQIPVAAGTLVMTAGSTMTFDSGDKLLGNFATVGINAGQQIVFNGTGSIKATNVAAVTLTAPQIVAAGGSNQSLSTSGSLTLQAGAGTAPAVPVNAIGGILMLSAAGITDSTEIVDLAGQLTLNATSGDIVLNSGAGIVATGSHIQLFDMAEDAPGGIVKFTASGNVMINSGTLIDVSATGNGYAGTLAITTGTGSMATLNGTLKGGAAYNDTGGNFMLNAGSLDPSSSLPFNSGFTGAFGVTLQQGNISVPAGVTLTSDQVALTASNGSVIVNGTIDASGPTGGAISLYGAGQSTTVTDVNGVTYNIVVGGVIIGASAQLLACYVSCDPTQQAISAADPGYANGEATLVQNGGTITLGTSGRFVPTGTASTDYNSADGYENLLSKTITVNNGAGTVQQQIYGSGAINIAAGATLNVSGGPGGGNVSNAGGSIIIQAPILSDGSVNVVVNAAPSSFKGASSIALNAFAVWSTDDKTSGSQHFDGIVDPAGWFDDSGAALPGTDQNGNPINAPTPQAPLQTDQFFTPTTPNSDHVGFYQATLKNFVGQFSLANGSSFTGMHLRPEIDLINPDSAVNGGGITVASNWNLGAVATDGGGNQSLVYRTANGEPGVLTLRALKGVAINATISDGFYYSPPASVLPSATAAGAQAAYQNAQEQMEGIGDLINADGSTTPISSLSPMAPGVVTGSAQGVGLYYAAYIAYTNEFVPTDAGTSTFIDYLGYYFGSFVGDPSAAPVAPTQAGYQSYQFYLQQYNKYLWSPSMGDSGNSGAPPLPPPPTAPVVAPYVISASSANDIASNPTVSTPNISAIANSNPVAAGFLGSAGSFSYHFVAGADFSSPNPTAVVAGGSGDVTINGHTSFTTLNPFIGKAFSPIIDIPTMVRTGTGSITIDAAGSFELLDTVSPGVVYTAGVATTTLPLNYTAPALPVSAFGVTNGLVNTPTWATGGGSVTIDAGVNIVGIESPVDDSTGDQTFVSKGPTGEFWTTWYYRSGNSTGQQSTPFAPGTGIQNSTWINYGTFFQGIGALGGGNVTLKAGNNIDDISASLPETIQVSGGQFASGPAAAATYYGGGDLVVRAGANLYSSTFYVGRGAGSIVAGGTIATDPLNPVTGKATTYQDVSQNRVIGTAQPLPLLLAVQDGFISVSAGQSISLGGTFDPTELPQNLSRLDIPNGVTVTPAGTGTVFHSYGANSGVALESTAGNIGIETLLDFNNVGTGSNSTTTLFSFSAVTGSGSSPAFVSAAAPATLNADAILGNITLNAPLGMVPSAAGTLQWLAGGSISSAFSSASAYFVFALTMLDNTAKASTDLALRSGATVPSVLGVTVPTVLSAPWHANDPDPAIIYAGGSITASFTLIKPARIEAGLDIINMKLIGENNNPGDITSVIAGRDIIATSVTTGIQVNNNTSGFEIFGPGTFLIQAGRNLGPFFVGAPPTVLGSSIIGIEAVGDGSNTGIPTAYKPFLPVQGADVYTLFGVGNGINYQSAIADFVDPALAGTGGIDLLSYIATSLGESRDLAWLTFKSLPAIRQHLLVDNAYLQFLSQVGLDYNDPSSTYFHQYARAYDVISTLFPASLGYTDNRPAGTSGTAATVSTGDLSLAHSLLETQTGGNIYLIGPGGNIIAGANAADNTPVQQEGILTLQGGSIMSYTDQSVEVYQSRIFTEQGGNIDLFTANGNLNAGKGKKSSAAYPPLKLILDVDGYSHVSPTGLVTGAGIGALLTVPGQDPDLSNVNLVAPRGTVDAGAAGIRVSGSLNIAALQVLNAFNIQVGGAVTGLPTVQGPPVAALTSATNTAGAAVKTAEAPKSDSASQQASIIIVEFLGFGGGEDDQQQPVRQDEINKRQRQSYNPDGAVQVVGHGQLTDEQKMQLNAQEQQGL